MASASPELSGIVSRDPSGAGAMTRTRGGGRIGPAEASQGELDVEVDGPADVDRREVERRLEVVGPEHDRHEVDRSVGPQAGEELSPAVAELAVRIVDPRGPAAESVLDHLPARAELEAGHAGPAGVPAEAPDGALPAVGVRVAEADDRARGRVALGRHRVGRSVSEHLRPDIGMTATILRLAARHDADTRHGAFRFFSVRPGTGSVGSRSQV